MRIAVIPGDGIGQEVIPEALRVLDIIKTKHNLTIETTNFDFGADRFLRDGTTLPDAALKDFSENYNAIFVGAFGDPRVPDSRHAREILLRMRFDLDLYINLRPMKLLADRLTPLEKKSTDDINITCFRENTEDIYGGVGGVFKKDTPDEVAINESINTRKGVERIIRAAFAVARQNPLANKKRRVCMSDKSNAMRFAGDLWQRTFAAVKAEYPDVEAEHMYIDVLAMRLVQNPERFDIIVTSNLFGDIITDLGAGLTGGLGVAASANIHPGRVSLFEPVHGSAPDIAGQNKANPLGAILTLALMLEYLGAVEAAKDIEVAVKKCISDNILTPDLGGTHDTKAVGEYVANLLHAWRP